MDEEKQPDILDEAEDVIADEYDRLLVIGVVGAIIIFAVAFAMGWIGKTARNAPKVGAAKK